MCLHTVFQGRKTSINPITEWTFGPEAKWIPFLAMTINRSTTSLDIENTRLSLHAFIFQCSRNLRVCTFISFQYADKLVFLFCGAGGFLDQWTNLIVYSSHSVVVIATEIHLSCKQTKGSWDNWVLVCKSPLPSFRSFAIYVDPPCSHPAHAIRFLGPRRNSSNHKVIKPFNRYICSESLLAIYISFERNPAYWYSSAKTPETILEHLPNHPSLPKDQAQLEWQWHQSVLTKIAVGAIFGSKALNEARNIGAP